MSDPQIGEIVDRMLAGASPHDLSEDWRELIDLASDFLPPRQAVAISDLLTDPSATVADLPGVIAASPAFEVNDGAVRIGSVEPESLDFEVVGELTEASTGAGPPSDVVDIDFGSGGEDFSDDVDLAAAGSDFEDLDAPAVDWGVSFEDHTEDSLFDPLDPAEPIDLFAADDEIEADDVDI